MRILSRLPDDMLHELRNLDTTAGRHLEHPTVDDLLLTATGDPGREPLDNPRVSAGSVTAGEGARPDRRTHRRAAGIAVLLAASAAVTAVVVAAWPAGTSQGDPSSASTNGAQAWSTFPVGNSPRPVVLVGSSIVDPASGFADGNAKMAYIDHRFHVIAALPTAPASADGYSISTPQDAIAELTGGAGTHNDPSALEITQVTLAEREFATDRGLQDLPAWAVRIAGVAADAYVLAVAPSDRFRYSSPGQQPGVGAGSLTADGDTVTFAFTPSHQSTDPCDPAFTETLAIEQNPTVVTLTITRTVAAPTTTPTADVACASDGRHKSSPVPVPGSPGTRTVTLSAPLGNRPVIDSDGTPWIVNVRG